MSTVVEGNKAVVIAGPARLLGEADRELAWAEKHVRLDKDLRWVLGNYVEADRANANGHIFRLEDLPKAAETVANKPLNMYHQPHRIVGHYVSAEILYPNGEEAAAADDGGPRPFMEALAAFWRFYFPEESRLIEAAHAEGTLFYSMETQPEELGCRTEGCGRVFAYRGPMHASYCEHVGRPGAPRALIRPHFNAGAIIIPPVMPGWSNAKVKELSALVAADMARAEATYEDVKADAPHLDPRQWEELMAGIMAMAEGVTA